MDFQQILYSIILPTVLTLIVTAVFNKVVIDGSKKRKAQKDKEQIENIKNVITEANKPLVEKVDKIEQDLRITKEGIQAELRHDIRNSCRRCIAQGYRTEDDTVEVVQMHEKYEALGSNGVTNALYEDFLKLKLVPNNYKYRLNE